MARITYGIGGNMKLTCNGTLLSDALMRVMKALPVKKTMPILEGIKMTAEGNSLTLTATDTEFAIQKTINADVKMEGEALIPGKLFGEFVKKLPDEDVEISFMDEQNLFIKYMDSETCFKAMKLKDYPPIQEFDYEIKVSMLQKDLKDLIGKTIFCAATDDVRPVLKGCLFEIKNNKIKCVALDGFRLAVSSKELAKSYPDTTAIIPAKNLSEIFRLMDEDEEIVTLNFCDKKIMVDMKHTRIISNLMTGTFIRYEASIPSSFETVMTIDKTMLENCLERAYVMSRFEKSNLIQIDIREGGKMTITTNSELGEVKEVISVFSNGKDMTILFNSKYLLDCMKVIEDQFIKLSLTNPTSPSVISPVEGDGYMYMILPLRGGFNR